MQSPRPAPRLPTHWSEGERERAGVLKSSIFHLNIKESNKQNPGLCNQSSIINDYNSRLGPVDMRIATRNRTATVCLCRPCSVACPLYQRFLCAAARASSVDRTPECFSLSLLAGSSIVAREVARACLSSLGSPLPLLGLPGSCASVGAFLGCLSRH